MPDRSPKAVIPAFGTVPAIVAYERLYDRRYRRLRADYLRANPLCERCRRLAQELHHRIPTRLGGAVHDVGNFEALCKECHTLADEQNRQAARAGQGG